MKTKILQGAAVFLILEIGFTHLVTAQHAFEESWVEGLLFVANFLGALVAAYGIYRNKTWGWVLGVLVSAGAMVAYTWSRTTGLPGLPPEEWLDPWGTAALITEGLFCLLVLLWFLQRNVSGAAPARLTKRWCCSLTVLGLFALMAINFSAFRLDTLAPEEDHLHVFFLWQVKLQPQITFNTFEEQYGMQIARATVSAEDSVVDVRMKVLDDEKADQLIEDGHFALLVGDTLIPAPHIHRHMLKNKMVIVFFPNRNDIVKSGTRVSIVFENLRTEPFTVQ